MSVKGMVRRKRSQQMFTCKKKQRLSLTGICGATETEVLIMVSQRALWFTNRRERAIDECTVLYIAMYANYGVLHYSYSSYEYGAHTIMQLFPTSYRLMISIYHCLSPWQPHGSVQVRDGTTKQILTLHIAKHMPSTIVSTSHTAM